MILFDKKLIFIHIPKCAGTAVEVFFAGRTWSNINKKTTHITAQEAVKLYGRETWDSCFTFSVVRNPWARLLSFFNMFRQTNPKAEFDSWIRQVCSRKGLRFEGIQVERSMTEYLAGPDGQIMVNFVGKMESLADDFRTIAQRAGYPPTATLPPVMVAKYDRDYRTLYTPETRDLVAERYREDVQRFGYDY
jgi:hypothetical protein